MSTYEFSPIASNVEMPQKVRTTKHSPLYNHLDKLNIGDSFVIRDVEVRDVASLVYSTAKRLGIKVSLRPVEDATDGDGVGVWRVSNPDPQTRMEQEKERTGHGTATPVRMPRRRRVRDEVDNESRKAG